MQLDMKFLKYFNSQCSSKWSYLESCYIHLEQHCFQLFLPHRLFREMIPGQLKCRFLLRMLKSYCYYLLPSAEMRRDRVISLIKRNVWEVYSLSEVYNFNTITRKLSLSQVLPILFPYLQWNNLYICASLSLIIYPACWTFEACTLFTTRASRLKKSFKKRFSLTIFAEIWVKREYVHRSWTHAVLMLC